MSSLPSRGEFIAIVAMLFASIAFSIDAMLPAFPELTAQFSPDDPNRVPLIVTIFMLGMGFGTFFTGPLSDAFGRKTVVLGTAALYILSALGALLAHSLEMLLVARFMQGLGAAGPRVVALAIVRDLYAGRAMARIMSIVMAAFIIVPVVAPALGQGLILLGGWRSTFAGLVVLAGMVSYNYSEHFQRRFDGFLNPEVDPTSQLGYAENAIREGGFFGVGVGEGQVKWSLPDAHTDFIIAVAAEEYGLILVLLILTLYSAIVMRSLIRLMRERDPFIRLAGTGLAAMFGVQAMINMGVAVRLLPAKGMTLPFVSYGGSSLIAGGIAVGMLLAFTRTRPQGEIRDILRGRARG